MADRPMSNIGFRMMSAFINRRNRKNPPGKILKDAGVKPRYRVLDFGCGPGGHSIAAAELVGEQGKVYALDIHPMALKKVQKLASDKGLTNIETIHSYCATGLEAESLDMVMLYDIFHMLGDREAVLNELHRVLKPDATLSFNDHHMQEDEIISGVEAGGLFKLYGRSEKTYSFVRLNKGGRNGRKRTNP
jgi:ubiquinone/menaquinone biosynthesis C-methylase UbiE